MAFENHVPAIAGSNAPSLVNFLLLQVLYSLKIYGDGALDIKAHSA